MTFKENNYFVFDEFLDANFVEFIQEYYSLKINSGEIDFDNQSFNYGYNFYSDHLMEVVLQNSCEPLSKLIDINLFPTYSSTKFMMIGDNFESLKDNSNEIVGIINLGSYEEQSYEIQMSKYKNKKNNTQIILNVGDLLLFQNNELYCWISEIKHQWTLIGILNFVNSKGPYKENIYNKRPYLGFKNLNNNIGE